MNKRYFTEHEANETIPKVKRELAGLKSVTQSFGEQYEQLEQHKKTLLYRHKTKVDEDILFKKESRMEFMELEAQTFIRNLLSFGVKIIDIENGLIAFPAVLNGEEVELYWKEGQENVTLNPQVSLLERSKEDDRV
ncbi:DUF2203 family protein [Alkalihalobacillus sp. CinArs1]|uniref:DUF2203 family protein n=1 Tax=Alkalihalobacillus sp. CinArs1 TaxID=2995314 RepID=UPI0022DD6795|nr:DUF2203 family protein [Alkalihalobacillus sp. CinArs1]